MNQKRFRSYIIKGSGHKHIDYIKALGKARLEEIKEILKNEAKNHACARMVKNK